MNIRECDYDEAKRDVLVNLLDGSAQKLYVEAWKGVGATALLREVAEAVKKSEKREFDTVIKVVRPAPFRNRREMQRVVAEQLNHLLPPSVTAAAFDVEDEDNDFWPSKEFSSRDLLWKVAEEINKAVRDRRVLLVLCNNIAGGQSIQPYRLPFSIIGRSKGNAVLWTSGMNISMGAASADYIVRIRARDKDEALDLVYKEAVEIARYIDESSGGSLRTTLQVVLRCFWYCLLLLHHRAEFNRSALLPDGGRPLEAAVKYFVCDGILQGDDAASWEIGKALAPQIGPIVNDQQLQYWQNVLTASTWAPRGVNDQLLQYWQNELTKKELLPPKTLLVHSTTQGDWVKFSLPSSSSEEEKKELLPWKTLSADSITRGDWVKFSLPSSSEEESSYRWISVRSPQTNIPEPRDFFFKEYRGSVLSDVSSVFWHFKKTHEVALPDGFFDHFSNVRVLDLLGCVVSPIEHSSFLRLRNLRMLRLEQCKVISLDLNSYSSAPEGRREPILFDNLWVLNLYNSDANAFLLGGKAFELMPNLLELDLTDCKGLEYLNFNLPATIETISIQRCALLKKVELVDPAAAPLPNLKTFRLSGSKLIAKFSLQGCRKLENVDLQELTGLEVLDLSCTAIKVVHISKLPQLKQLFLLGCEQLRRVVCCEDIRHPKGPRLDVLYLDNYNGGGACNVDQCLDSFRNQKPSELTERINDADQRLFHAHVVVKDVRLFRSLRDAFPDRLSRAKSCFHIHVKGSSTAKRGTNIGTTTRYLKCFRMERCPNFKFIFSSRGAAYSLESIWLSQLPGLKALHERERFGMGQLKHIYLEFCARLEYVFPPLWELHDLETINIRYCGDLTAIIKSNDDNNKDKRGAAPKLLPKLRSIHLQELPKLQHIYKLNSCAPSLEEIKIVGCFNLKKLPLFGRSDARSMRAVKISCEKDWWDKLQWDGLESNHHSSLFNPKHCPYYKKRMKARYL
uniref:Disease resistance protein At4g27190-like leucine-rich repeats domain-containing protein n=1 Tax=Ananas comosus var. bracteatus TaxID=296719 RepID=A0A6V7PPT4_ANACO|nr:unnamed protein product [Ananas comosus var. bracteatus]